MIEDCAKLMVYFGERDRAEGRFLADILLDLCEDRDTRASVLVRGTEGFGGKHQLQSQRLLSLSEDLPVVLAAVDAPQAIEALADEVAARFDHGLVTVERARLAGGVLDEGVLGPEPAKLTLMLGRHERIGRRPAFVAAVAALQEAGVDGASVLLGVDGTFEGTRHRGRFLSGNAQVPLMVVAMGAGAAVEGGLRALHELLDDPLVLLERVRVCKRAGERLADPDGHVRAGHWQKLMVHAPEDTQAGGHALHVTLVRRLLAAGADGATAIRGVWGYQGTEPPHGDRLLSVRRRVPVVTTIIDAPERAVGWYRIADELTASAGVITSELVPTRRV